ncbi:periplasmic heavy metal sensor [Jannaschia sp. Os4]|uniref:periplasmic heavy metal sensor n=1 Tax=Jannaschia sp. Os4 TaxID=2807617 RepID=UPI00193A6669|nr:periplasmic heavy metal sensor [Jannaschia sp. Os4]MBM2577065.1 periplasmic heavy metal sensor [Jannaschia sp. Os4]
MRRWVPWALAASLAVNLLVAGAVVGAMAMGGGDRARGFGGPPELALARALPKEERARLREALRDAAVRRGDRTRTRDAVVAALRAEPFDAAALELALVEAVERQRAPRAEAAAAIAAAVGRLAPEERAALVEAIGRRTRLR